MSSSSSTLLESTIEKPVVKWAESYGIEHIKMQLHNDAGWPDDVFMLPLRPAWIEFKRPGKKPRKLQEYRIAFLRSLGYDVQWFDNAERAIHWLKELHASRLSEAGYTVDDKTGVRGPPPGSWIGKDLDLVRSFFNSKGKEVC